MNDEKPVLDEKPTLDETPSIRDRFLTFMVEPMSLFWILIASVLTMGIIATVRQRTIAWEAFLSAAMLCLLVHVMAEYRDVHAWPWSGRKRPAEDDRQP